MNDAPRIRLTKQAPTISLAKAQRPGGIMRINLNWQQPSAPTGGFWSRLTGRSNAVDLDLACLFERKDGYKGVVQALGNAFVDDPSDAMVWLDGDDRSGSNTGGENLFVNLDKFDSLSRLVVFAFIYQGAPNWAEAAGVVTLYPIDAAPIEVRLDEASGAPMCAIATISNDNGTLRVAREVRYVDGHRELDQAYGWGLNWQAGSK